MLLLSVLLSSTHYDFFEENYPTIETLRMEVRNMESPPGGSQGGPPGLKYDRDHMAKAQKLTSLKRT